ncbi:MAG: response regulator transcription factor [Thauera sp.]|nr:response regulator transcription factor [Thauera sp.]
MPLSPTDNVQPPSSQPAIFVLEDDADVARLICMSLSDYGFRCEHLSTGRQLLARARQSAPDLCIVDLGLPDMDGMQVVRELQDGSPCAVLILTGRNDVTDRVLGLELGADDYIVKPFEPRELVARVRSILRRYQRAPAAEAPSERKLARFAGWSFDANRHALTAPDGREMSLSAAEAGLLATLLRRPNKILSREQLLGERDVDPFDRSIDVRISRLRRKLDDDPQNPKLIKTVYGAGYLFSAQVEWQ